MTLVAKEEAESAGGLVAMRGATSDRQRKRKPPRRKAIPAQPEPFPCFSVVNGVAEIKLRAKNGYAHRFRVHEKDIYFLQLCWPFEVSAGGKRKKIIRWVGGKRVYLHFLWLAYRRNLPSHQGFHRVPKCRNKNWLDWTQDNIYLPEVNAKSERRREIHFSRSLSETAKELIDARTRGPFQGVPSDDPEVVWAFQDSAKMPALPIRPKNRGPDESASSDDGDD